MKHRHLGVKLFEVTEKEYSVINCLCNANCTPLSLGGLCKCLKEPTRLSVAILAGISNKFGQPVTMEQLVRYTANLIRYCASVKDWKPALKLHYRLGDITDKEILKILERGKWKFFKEIVETCKKLADKDKEMGGQFLEKMVYVLFGEDNYSLNEIKPNLTKYCTMSTDEHCEVFELTLIMQISSKEISQKIGEVLKNG